MINFFFKSTFQYSTPAKDGIFDIPVFPAWQTAGRHVSRKNPGFIKMPLFQASCSISETLNYTGTKAGLRKTAQYPMKSPA